MSEKCRLVQDIKKFLVEDESLLSLPKDLRELPKFSRKAMVIEQQKESTIIDQPIKKVGGALDDLATQLSKCHLCSLSRTRHNVVIGYGNPKSILYVIGEAPGQEEDLKGAPFVGRSGLLLDKILSAIAISRDNIFITNIVKCRPPQNRDPKPEEIATCSPYLKQQIELGQPKIFLALGRYSAGFLLNDFKSSLGSLRGNIHNTEYGKVLVTYHPAAVLRAPNQRRPMVWADVKVLAQFLYKENFYNEEQIKILKQNKAL